MSPLTISSVQTNLIWENKQENLRVLGEKISALKGKTEIVVLPEMFSTGFSIEPQALAESMQGETISWMKSVATTNKIILTGSVIIEDGGKYFNRLIWMLPDGNYGYYDKRHLFAFAGENTHYSAGNKRLIASVKGWKINLLVCYDLRFPVWARQSATDKSADDGPEYDVLIYVANWPERRSLAWKILLSARAIENQCFVVGVNRVGTDANDLYYAGDSMMIDPMGKILYHGLATEEVFTYTLEKKILDDARKQFPFWKDQDHFSIEP
jgi:omega-amidase